MATQMSWHPIGLPFDAEAFVLPVHTRPSHMVPGHPACPG